MSTNNNNNIHLATILYPPTTVPQLRHLLPTPLGPTVASGTLDDTTPDALHEISWTSLLSPAQVPYTPFGPGPTPTLHEYSNARPNNNEHSLLYSIVLNRTDLIDQYLPSVSLQQLRLPESAALGIEMDLVYFAVSNGAFTSAKHLMQQHLILPNPIFSYGARSPLNIIDMALQQSNKRLFQAELFQFFELLFTLIPIQQNSCKDYISYIDSLPQKSIIPPTSPLHDTSPSSQLYTHSIPQYEGRFIALSKATENWTLYDEADMNGIKELLYKYASKWSNSTMYLAPSLPSQLPNSFKHNINHESNEHNNNVSNASINARKRELEWIKSRNMALARCGLSHNEDLVDEDITVLNNNIRSSHFNNDDGMSNQPFNTNFNDNANNNRQESIMSSQNQQNPLHNNNHSSFFDSNTHSQKDSIFMMNNRRSSLPLNTNNTSSFFSTSNTVTSNVPTVSGSVINENKNINNSTQLYNHNNPHHQFIHNQQEQLLNFLYAAIQRHIDFMCVREYTIMNICSSIPNGHMLFPNLIKTAAATKRDEAHERRRAEREANRKILQELKRTGKIGGNDTIDESIDDLDTDDSNSTHNITKEIPTERPANPLRNNYNVPLWAKSSTTLHGLWAHLLSTVIIPAVMNYTQLFCKETILNTAKIVTPTDHDDAHNDQVHKFDQVESDTDLIETIFSSINNSTFEDDNHPNLTGYGPAKGIVPPALTNNGNDLLMLLFLDEQRNEQVLRDLEQYIFSLKQQEDEALLNIAADHQETLTKRRHAAGYDFALDGSDEEELLVDPDDEEEIILNEWRKNTYLGDNKRKGNKSRKNDKDSYSSSSTKIRKSNNNHTPSHGDLTNTVDFDNDDEVMVPSYGLPDDEDQFFHIMDVLATIDPLQTIDLTTKRRYNKLLSPIRFKLHVAIGKFQQLSWKSTYRSFIIQQLMRSSLFFYRSNLLEFFTHAQDATLSQLDGATYLKFYQVASAIDTAPADNNNPALGPCTNLEFKQKLSTTSRATVQFVQDHKDHFTQLYKIDQQPLDLHLCWEQHQQHDLILMQYLGEYDTITKKRRKHQHPNGTSCNIDAAQDGNFDNQDNDDGISGDNNNGNNNNNMSQSSDSEEPYKQMYTHELSIINKLISSGLINLTCQHCQGECWVQCSCELANNTSGSTHNPLYSFDLSLLNASTDGGLPELNAFNPYNRITDQFKPPFKCSSSKCGQHQPILQLFQFLRLSEEYLIATEETVDNSYLLCSVHDSSFQNINNSQGFDAKNNTNNHNNPHGDDINLSDSINQLATTNSSLNHTPSSLPLLSTITSAQMTYISYILCPLMSSNHQGLSAFDLLSSKRNNTRTYTTAMTTFFYLLANPTPPDWISSYFFTKEPIHTMTIVNGDPALKTFPAYDIWEFPTTGLLPPPLNQDFNHNYALTYDTTTGQGAKYSPPSVLHTLFFKYSTILYNVHNESILDKSHWLRDPEKTTLLGFTFEFLDLLSPEYVPQSYVSPVDFYLRLLGLTADQFPLMDNLKSPHISTNGNRSTQSRNTIINTITNNDHHSQLQYMDEYDQPVPLEKRLSVENDHFTPKILNHAEPLLPTSYLTNPTSPRMQKSQNQHTTTASQTPKGHGNRGTFGFEQGDGDNTQPLSFQHRPSGLRPSANAHNAVLFNNQITNNDDGRGRYQGLQVQIDTDAQSTASGTSTMSHLPNADFTFGANFGPRRHNVGKNTLSELNNRRSVVQNQSTSKIQRNLPSIIEFKTGQWVKFQDKESALKSISTLLDLLPLYVSLGLFDISTVQKPNHHQQYREYQFNTFGVPNPRSPYLLFPNDPTFIKRPSKNIQPITEFGFPFGNNQNSNERNHHLDNHSDQLHHQCATPLSSSNQFPFPTNNQLSTANNHGVYRIDQTQQHSNSTNNNENNGNIVCLPEKMPTILTTLFAPAPFIAFVKDYAKKNLPSLVTYTGGSRTTSFSPFNFSTLPTAANAHQHALLFTSTIISYAHRQAQYQIVQSALRPNIGRESSANTTHTITNTTNNQPLPHPGTPDPFLSRTPAKADVSEPFKRPNVLSALRASVPNTGGAFNTSSQSGSFANASTPSHRGTLRNQITPGTVGIAFPADGIGNQTQQYQGATFDIVQDVNGIEVNYVEPSRPPEYSLFIGSIRPVLDFRFRYVRPTAKELPRLSLNETDDNKAGNSKKDKKDRKSSKHQNNQNNQNDQMVNSNNHEGSLFDMIQRKHNGTDQNSHGFNQNNPHFPNTNTLIDNNTHNQNQEFSSNSKLQLKLVSVGTVNRSNHPSNLKYYKSVASQTSSNSTSAHKLNSTINRLYVYGKTKSTFGANADTMNVSILRHIFNASQNLTQLQQLFYLLIHVFDHDSQRSCMCSCCHCACSVYSQPISLISPENLSPIVFEPKPTIMTSNARTSFADKSTVLQPSSSSHSTTQWLVPQSPTASTAGTSYLIDRVNSTHQRQSILDKFETGSNSSRSGSRLLQSQQQERQQINGPLSPPPQNNAIVQPFSIQQDPSFQTHSNPNVQFTNFSPQHHNIQSDYQMKRHSVSSAVSSQQQHLFPIDAINRYDTRDSSSVLTQFATEMNQTGANYDQTALAITQLVANHPGGLLVNNNNNNNNNNNINGMVQNNSSLPTSTSQLFQTFSPQVQQSYHGSALPTAHSADPLFNQNNDTSASQIGSNSSQVGIQSTMHHAQQQLANAITHTRSALVGLRVGTRPTSFPRNYILYYDTKGNAYNTYQHMANVMMWLVKLEPHCRNYQSAIQFDEDLYGDDEIFGDFSTTQQDVFDGEHGNKPDDDITSNTNTNDTQQTNDTGLNSLTARNNGPSGMLGHDLFSPGGTTNFIHQNNNNYHNNTTTAISLSSNPAGTAIGYDNNNNSSKNANPNEEQTNNLGQDELFAIPNPFGTDVINPGSIANHRSNQELNNSKKLIQVALQLSEIDLQQLLFNALCELNVAKIEALLILGASPNSTLMKSATQKVILHTPLNFLLIRCILLKPSEYNWQLHHLIVTIIKLLHKYGLQVSNASTDGTTCLHILVEFFTDQVSALMNIATSNSKDIFNPTMKSSAINTRINRHVKRVNTLSTALFTPTPSGSSTPLSVAGNSFTFNRGSVKNDDMISLGLSPQLQLDVMRANNQDTQSQSGGTTPVTSAMHGLRISTPTLSHQASTGTKSHQALTAVNQPLHAQNAPLLPLDSILSPTQRLHVTMATDIGDGPSFSDDSTFQLAQQSGLQAEFFRPQPPPIPADVDHLSDHQEAFGQFVNSVVHEANLSESGDEGELISATRQTLTNQSAQFTNRNQPGSAVPYNPVSDNKNGKNYYLSLTDDNSTFPTINLYQQTSQPINDVETQKPTNNQDNSGFTMGDGTLEHRLVQTRNDPRLNNRLFVQLPPQQAPSRPESSSSFVSGNTITYGPVKEKTHVWLPNQPPVAVFQPQTCKDVSLSLIFIMLQGYCPALTNKLDDIGRPLVSMLANARFVATTIDLSEQTPAQVVYKAYMENLKQTSQQHQKQTNQQSSSQRKHRHASAGSSSSTRTTSRPTCVYDRLSRALLGTEDAKGYNDQYIAQQFDEQVQFYRKWAFARSSTLADAPLTDTSSMSGSISSQHLAFSPYYSSQRSSDTTNNITNQNNPGDKDGLEINPNDQFYIAPIQHYSLPYLVCNRFIDPRFTFTKPQLDVLTHVRTMTDEYITDINIPAFGPAPQPLSSAPVEYHNGPYQPQHMHHHYHRYNGQYSQPQPSQLLNRYANKVVSYNYDMYEMLNDKYRKVTKITFYYNRYCQIDKMLKAFMNSLIRMQPDFDLKTLSLLLHLISTTSTTPLLADTKRINANKPEKEFPKIDTTDNGFQVPLPVYKPSSYLRASGIQSLTPLHRIVQSGSGEDSISSPFASNEVNILIPFLLATWLDCYKIFLPETLPLLQGSSLLPSFREIFDSVQSE